MLMRHGEAEASSPQGDRYRALTPRGYVQARDTALRAQARGLAPDLIFISPYARAMQTARVVAAALEYRGVIAYSKKLKPDTAPADLRTELDGHRTLGQVLCITHLPLIAAATELLCGEIVAFHNAAMVCIEDGKLLWSLRP